MMIEAVRAPKLPGVQLAREDLNSLKAMYKGGISAARACKSAGATRRVTRILQ